MRGHAVAIAEILSQRNGAGREPVVTSTEIRPPAPLSTEREVVKPGVRRGSRRWLRVVIPLRGGRTDMDGHRSGALVPGTGSERLADAGPGRCRSAWLSLLAGQLEAAGVSIVRVTSSAAAVAQASTGDATLFVPAPDYLDPQFVLQVSRMPGRHRIVLVRPGRRAILTATVPAGVHSSRWATAIVAPQCETDYARRAGAAAVHRDAYDGDRPSTLCYDGSLIGFQREDVRSSLSARPSRSATIASGRRATPRSRPAYSPSSGE